MKKIFTAAYCAVKKFTTFILKFAMIAFKHFHKSSRRNEMKISKENKV